VHLPHQTDVPDAGPIPHPRRVPLPPHRHTRRRASLEPEQLSGGLGLRRERAVAAEGEPQRPRIVATSAPEAEHRRDLGAGDGVEHDGPDLTPPGGVTKNAGDLLADALTEDDATRGETEVMQDASGEATLATHPRDERDQVLSDEREPDRAGAEEGIDVDRATQAPPHTD
jgi:hypothetical protein